MAQNDRQPICKARAEEWRDIRLVRSRSQGAPVSGGERVDEGVGLIKCAMRSPAPRIMYARGALLYDNSYRKKQAQNAEYAHGCYYAAGENHPLKEFNWLFGSTNNYSSLTSGVFDVDQAVAECVPPLLR